MKKTTYITLGVVFLTILVISVLMFMKSENLGMEVDKTETPIANATSTIIPSEKEISTSEKTALNFASTTVPEGWKTYVDEEWRFMFAYPAHWSFKDHALATGFRVLDLAGDEYSIRISKMSGGDTDSPRSYYMTKIDGSDARVFPTERDEGYLLQIFNSKPYLRIGIQTPTKDKELSDKFLSTVRFEKSQ